MPAPTRVRVGLAAALLAALPALAACGAGRSAVTAHERSAVDGAQADRGSLQLRNVYLAAPASGTEWAAGSDVPLVVYVVNRGEADQLTGASAPGVAASVELTPSSIELGVGGLLRTSADPSTTMAIQQASAKVPTSIVLKGLTKRLLPGQTVPITLTFQRAGDVTMQVPVATSSQG